MLFSVWLLCIQSNRMNDKIHRVADKLSHFAQIHLKAQIKKQDFYNHTKEIIEKNAMEIVEKAKSQKLINSDQKKELVDTQAKSTVTQLQIMTMQLFPKKLHKRNVSMHFM